MKNLDNIRAQIELLKQRLDSIDKTLDLQEEVLDLLNENSKSLLQDVRSFNKNTKESAIDIMKKAFPSGKIPKILFKNS